MKRESFVFYSSWLEAIKNLPRDVQGDVLTAIIEYGLTGETTEQLKPITKAMLAMVKPQIDTNNLSYENGKKGSDYGKLGGRPRKKDNPNETPPKPQDNPNETPNVYDNVYDNEDKKESPNGDKKEGEPSSPPLNPDYLKFNDWLKRKAKYCSNPKNFPSQITEAEFLKLKEKYTGKQIADVIEQIENRKDLRKRYTNLYRTVLNWAKKEYGS